MWQAWHRPTQCGGGFIGSSNLCGSTARWQRKLDPKMSQPYRPWHTHDEKWPLKPGEPVELDIEIWPTCIVVPPGYQLALTVRGKDYEVDGRRGTAERALPDEGRRPLPAYRPRRPSGKDFWAAATRCILPRASSLTSCCRSFRKGKLHPKIIN
jgi:predicted acyl esterase